MDGMDDLLVQMGLSRTLDIFSVKSGLKKGSRVRVTRDNLKYLLSVCKSLGLSMSVSNYSVPVLEASAGNFSEWFRRENPRVSQKADCHVYIGSSTLAAEELRFLDEVSDHAAAGSYFGYPSCCIKKFIKDTASLPNQDLLFHSFSGWLIIPWQLNVALSYFDKSLFSYYPCSPFCQPSLDFANARLAIVSQFLPEQAPGIIADLQLSVCLGRNDLGAIAFSGAWVEQGYAVHGISKKTKTIAELISNHSVLMPAGGTLTIDNIPFHNNMIRLFIHK